MAETLEQRRSRLRRFREEIGSRELVGQLIDRSYRSISSYEAKGGPLPAWYEIVIEELYRRKRLGQTLSLTPR